MARSHVRPSYRGSSVSFNRLFSDYFGSFLIDGTDMSNVHLLCAGVDLNPTEKLTLDLAATKLLVDAPFSRPLAPWFGFLSRVNSEDLGWETALAASYQYAADLYLAVGWYHLFVEDGLSDGHFIAANGLGFTGGSITDDSDVVYFETGISF